MSLADALAVLKKDMRPALEFDDKIESITTGSTAVDYITGIGGFPRGRLSEVFGWESCGKTTLALSSCANAQRKGLAAAYIDMERAVSLEHASKLGFDYRNNEKGIYLSPGNFEECASAVQTLAENAVDLIVVDSVPAMTPKSQMEGDIDAGGAIGEQSRLMAKFLSIITKTIADKNVALVMINQMRAKINTAPGSRWDPTEQSAGGSALKFYGSLRIDMTLLKKIVEKAPNPFGGQDWQQPIKNYIRAEAFKNKVATPYRRCEFYIQYGTNGVYGIDNLQTVIDFAKYKGVIQMDRSGNYKISGPDGQEVTGRGTEELYHKLAGDPELRKKVRESAGI